MNTEETNFSLPLSIGQKLEGYEWYEILIGCSESRVFRLENSLRQTLYLKISPANSSMLRQEKERLDWLSGKLSVPEVLDFFVFEHKNYLLMSEIVGVNSHEIVFQGNEREIIHQLVAGLKQIYGLPIESCPFEMRLDHKIKLAEERMRKGLVDENDFDEERTGRTAESLFAELLQTRPGDEDLVFTHGDFCLPNIIYKSGLISGFVDLGNAGVADKYQDIALLARSLKHNFGTEAAEILFETMNIKPNAEKIRFYTLLDEFF